MPIRFETYILFAKAQVKIMLVGYLSIFPVGGIGKEA